MLRSALHQDGVRTFTFPPSLPLVGISGHINSAPLCAASPYVKMAARPSPLCPPPRWRRPFSLLARGGGGRSPGGRLCRAGEVSSGVGPPRCGQKEPEPARGRVGAEEGRCGQVGAGGDGLRPVCLLPRCSPSGGRPGGAAPVGRGRL